MNTKTKTLLCFTAILLPPMLFAAPRITEEKVLNTMKRATEYMMDEVSYNGGFLWAYLPDFSRCWGEIEARPTMAWTQSPGTPQVGHLMLDAYHATGDEYYYQAAERVGNALIWGQLECGGWNYVFDFAGEESLKEWYATVGRSAWRLEEFQHYYGNATFDDASTTQCATFLLRLYVEKYDPRYLPALEKAINFVLESQYPSGGWPQRYPLMHDHPVGGLEDYSSFITLNDDVMPEAIDFLIQCRQALGIQELKGPILRGMYCIMLLQQGEPYRGWGDQYTVEDLKPAHARTYEPRALNPATTLAMVRQLMQYYRYTGDSRFLAGIPDAIEFVESLRLPEEEVSKWGRPSPDPEAFLVPRFIDPDSGIPLYVHREGSNVYNGRYYCDQDITGTIGHYSSAAWVNTQRLRRQYEELLEIPVEQLTEGSPLLETSLVPLNEYYMALDGRGDRATVEEIVNGLDSQGRWLSPLTNTSNPYIPCDDSTPSKDRSYVTDFVGDEYDTSPYRSTEEILCISTRDYLNKMVTLIQYILENRK